MKCLTLLFIVLIAYEPVNLFGQSPVLKLTSDEVQQNNAFGDIVALDGEHIVVGAFLDTNEHGEKAGAAYIFEREGDTWRQAARVVGSGVGPEDRFGEALAIDGDYLLAANRSEGESGAIYVFMKQDSTWTEQTSLTVDDAQTDERLGTTVLFQDPYAFIGGSSTRVFKRDGDVWTHQARLATDAAEDVQPQSVSGDYLVTKRSFINSSGTASVHEIYVFMRDGENWIQHARITGDDVGDGEWLRARATLSGDLLVIGAGTQFLSSSDIYIFKREESDWVLQTEITAEDMSTETLFISEMVLAGDVLLVGDSSADPNGEHSGSAYVLRREDDTWTELVNLIPADGVAHDRFGTSGAMDDLYIIIGQDGHQVGDTLPSGFGAAYVYSLMDVIATGVDEVPEANHEMSPSYPNPFSTQSTFALGIKQHQHVTIGVYDLLGRLVVVLHDGMLHADTSHRFTFNANGLSSGAYLVRVSAESGTASQIIYLVR